MTRNSRKKRISKSFSLDIRSSKRWLSFFIGEQNVHLFKLAVACIISLMSEVCLWYPCQWAPVEPVGVSGISACHFQNCLSLDKLRFVQVGQASFEYKWAVESETRKISCTVFSNPFLEFCFLAPSFLSSSCSTSSSSWPPLTFHHLVLQVCRSIWLFENSRALLWYPRYSKKGDLPEHFASTFFSCYAIFSWIWTYKLMTSLIINLLLAVLYLQLLPSDSDDDRKA